MGDLGPYGRNFRIAGSETGYEQLVLYIRHTPTQYFCLDMSSDWFNACLIGGFTTEPGLSSSPRLAPTFLFPQFCHPACSEGHPLGYVARGCCGGEMSSLSSSQQWQQHGEGSDTWKSWETCGILLTRKLLEFHLWSGIISIVSLFMLVLTL